MPRNEVFFWLFVVAFLVTLLEESERIQPTLSPSSTTSPGFSCWDIKQFNGPRLSAFCTNQRLSSIFLASPRQQSLKNNLRQVSWSRSKSQVTCQFCCFTWMTIYELSAIDVDKNMETCHKSQQFIYITLTSRKEKTVFDKGNLPENTQKVSNSNPQLTISRGNMIF